MTWALGGAGLDVLGTLGHFFLSTDAALQSRRRAKGRGARWSGWLAGWLAVWLAGLRLPCFGRLLLQPAAVLRCSAVWCGALYLL